MNRSAPPRHDDRTHLPHWLLGAIAVATAACGGAAGVVAVVGTSASPTVGLVAGSGVGLLAVLGLPSLSVRLVARVVLASSAGIMVRFGALTGSLTSDSQEVLGWVVAAATVLVLTDRIGTEAEPGLGPVGAASAHPVPSRSSGGSGARAHDRTPAEAGRAGPARTARTSLVVAGAVLVLVLVLTPFALPRMSRSASIGGAPRLPKDRGGSSVLRSSDSLDMTSRPDLTDEVVFRVTTDRPTFWRGQVFDQWDGRRWTRSDEERYAMRGGAVISDRDDLGVGGADEFTQRFRIETTFSDVVYGAPSIVAVEADRLLAQRLDGTVTTVDTAFGRGATYEVATRRPLLSEPLLRAARGPVPDDITARYATPTVITDRVRQAARAVAADAPTTYDKVRALERWMGGRTEYSLDAPLSPSGVDVVDHFLFESRRGWCEQVASSLVVLARANGIPARLVTGFVPEERDRVTGTYVVRARDAHAWTEVWFPDVGWVPFDPTADVPLAASVRAEASWGNWLVDHALVIALGLAVAVAVGRPFAAWIGRRRRRAAGRPTTWAARTDRRLVGLGERVDRVRSEGETATVYASAMAERYHDERLVAVGRGIDDSLFARRPPGPDRRAEVDRVLDDVSAAEAPPPPPPTPPPPTPPPAGHGPHPERSRAPGDPPPTTGGGPR